MASEDELDSDDDEEEPSTMEAERQKESQHDFDGCERHGSEGTAPPFSPLPVGFSDAERAEIDDLGSRAGDSSMRLYFCTALPRWKAFVLHAGWQHATAAVWLDAEHEPINGIFERFFTYLEKDANETTACTFVCADPTLP